MAYYAYGSIRYDGGVIASGEKVDQKTLGVSDEEWEYLIETNAIVDEQLPDDLKSTESLSTYKLRKAREAMDEAQAEVSGTAPKKKSTSRKTSVLEKVDEPATSES